MIRKYQQAGLTAPSTVAGILLKHLSVLININYLVWRKNYSIQNLQINSLSKQFDLLATLNNLVHEVYDQDQYKQYKA